MIPYSVTSGDIHDDDLTALAVVQSAVALLPEPPGVVLTCHMVARLMAVLAPRFSLVDGYFLCGYEHSWLQRGDVILDCYPIAGTEPFLIWAGRLSPWKSFYQQAKLPADRIDAAQDIVERFRTGAILLQHPA